MPFLPKIEPLRRSARERLEGRGPSLGARFQHAMKQLSPNWNFVLKWVASCTFLLTAITIVAFLIVNAGLRADDRNARSKRAEQVAEVKRKEKAVIDRAAEAEAFADIEAHARGNWETWKSQFTTDADGIACAFGHTFNASQKLFEISCQIGPKGHLPTTMIVCNQTICRAAAPTPTPAPTPPAPEAKNK